jgi:hypothetical protein
LVARLAVLRAPDAAFFAVLRAVLRPELFFAELLRADFFAAVLRPELFLAGLLRADFLAELLRADFFAAVLRPELFLAERFFDELVRPDDEAATAPSTADTAAPAAASAASAASLAAVFAAVAAREAVDEDCLRVLVAAAFLPAALRLVLLERELLLRAGAI